MPVTTRLLMRSGFVMLDLVLAERVGVNETLFLARLHYHLEAEHGFTQGDTRFYRNTSAQWAAELRVMSQRTVERLISKLEDADLIRSVKAGTFHDQTKGYTINYEHPDLRQSGGLHTDKMAGCHTDKVAGCSIDTKKQTKTQGSTTTVADVMLAHQDSYDREEQLQTVRNNPKHGPTLAKFWQRAMSQYGHAHATQPKLSVKDQKMLKDIVERLPEGEVKILDVLEHYALFVKFARDGYNVNLAAKPQVQKLLYAIDAMAEFEAPGKQLEEVDYDNLGLKGLEDGSSDNNA
jgi:DNA-binding Lrp family transcriptional regulator